MADHTSHLVERKIRLSLCDPLIRSRVFSRVNEVQNILSPLDVDAQSSSYHQCERFMEGKKGQITFKKIIILIAT